jgi:2-oxoglutarate decarboxylase
MLLPHGYEGQGPEHSSARIERFLLMCAEDNIQVVNATTAAQYFHVLRRQMRREVRKPLVLFTPKSPLRMAQSRSTIDDLTAGAFEEVLDDPTVADPSAIRRIVFCSGKVCWDAFAQRDKLGAPVAIIRIEQLFPFPAEQMLAILERYPNAKDLLWLQEEPENMGPWTFIEHRTFRIKDRGYSIRHVARVESGSPATGSAEIHRQELAELLDETFAGL